MTDEEFQKALNDQQRAFDVQLSELRTSHLDETERMQAETEKALKEAATRRVDDLREMQSKYSDMIEERNQALQGLMKSLNDCQQMNRVLEARWQSQNQYVITLENQSTGIIKAALVAYADAQLDVQIEARRQRNANA